MATYNTEQKKLLVEFLKMNADKSLTVEEIVEKMGGKLAKSTVYRLIMRLTEEGLVKRMTRGNSRTFVYQMIAISGERCHAHLHLRCTDCGKVIHMKESVSHELLDAIRQESDFSVSERETVILGKCAVCGVKGK